MRRTKANRALTFVMAAALLIGSIHGVGAKEQSKDYDAPELTLVQGASDYDLTAGITYDSEKYILSVTDTGNFDINVVGDYEISYTLTGKENSVKETESVESTEITENTEVTKSTEAVSGTETVADTETGEDTGTLPEGNDSVDGADGADISEPDNADESTDVEEPDADTVNITEEQTPKAANASQKVINFSRTVKVVAAEEPVETYAVNDGVATYANTQGNYTVNLGTPVWTDSTHTKFQYTNAKINTDGDGISLMTITLSNGRLPDDILGNANMSDVSGKSVTWIFGDEKSSQEIQEKIQNMTFDYANNMNIYVSINGNDNKGFSNLNSQMKLTQWSKNGHYYLYIPEQLSWSKAYNKAMDFKLAGQQGYLSTTTSEEELAYLVNLNSEKTWVAGTRLIRVNGSLLNNDKVEMSAGVLKYRSMQTTSDVNLNKTHYYWTAGPEAGLSIEDLWRSGEPNQGDYTTYQWSPIDMTLSDVQRFESCVMVLTDVKKLNDYCE